METILQTLSRSGSVLTKFDSRKQPDRKLFSLRLDTAQIVWSDRNGANVKLVEGLVDIRTIKEIRRDKNSKDFEKFAEEARRYQRAECFVIHYGTEFSLATISCAADSDEIAKKWVNALLHLMKEISSASYIQQVNRWLRTEFHGRDYRVAITLQDLKDIMYRLNFKVPLLLLREVFQEFDTTYSQEISFQDFASIYHKFVLVEQIFCDHFPAHFKHKKALTLSEFKHFLEKEQGTKWKKSESALVEHLKTFRQEGKAEADDGCLTMSEFLGYLFSKSNSVWDSVHDDITHDMDQPLTSYWIASSHNTYLTGNSLTSDSSVEAYARCLRLGSRCVELDTFDGADGMPIIYHGYTLTTKIRFIDVIKCIKDHAFATSEYPVILSIEDHCSLNQQRKMAKIFQDILGDMLLTQSVDRNETCMPSPEQLKRKIIIKHKRLPEGVETSQIAPHDRATRKSSDCDLPGKKGLMYLEDILNREWVPYVFCLDSTKLFVQKKEDTENNQSDVESQNGENGLPVQPRGSDDLHFREEWFHGKLPNRMKAEELMHNYNYMPDGLFLVRNSETFVGDYSLSVLQSGIVRHCRIQTKPEENHGNRFYLVEGNKFSNLCDLVEFYHKNSFKSKEFNFEIILTEPVPQPQPHIDKDWFFETITKEEAENILRKVNRDGIFLIRKSASIEGDFVISFRAERQVKHCRILRDGRLFVIGSALFETLVELVEYYEEIPLYRKVKLKKEQNGNLLNRTDFRNQYYQLHNATPSVYVTLSISCRALRDYQAQLPDEHSFTKGTIITNVLKENYGWWRGDCNDRIQQRFPSNYVEELDMNGQNNGDFADENTLETNQGKPYELRGATVQELPRGYSGRDFALRLQLPNSSESLQIACDTAHDLETWLKAIQESVRTLDEQCNRERKSERTFHCAKELSKIIVYCRAVSPSSELLGPAPNFREMCSFPEVRAGKWISPEKCTTFLKYNRNQFSRIYPMGTRFNSSNFDPTPMWNCGSQMVALNYQTPDIPMQLNQGRFMQNGQTGYVLQPEFMRTDTYDPYDALTLKDVEPKLLSVSIIAGRNFVKTAKSGMKGITSPFVGVEIVGADYDCNKFKTATVPENGFNPIWNETCTFDIHNPDLALIRFVVQDIDIFGEPNFLGQATFPIRCIRTGFRSVPLKNGWGEDLALSSLLVRIQCKTLKNEDRVLYREIQQLRHETRDLSRQIEELQISGDVTKELQHRLQAAQDVLQQKTEKQQKNTVSPTISQQNRHGLSPSSLIEAPGFRCGEQGQNCRQMKNNSIENAKSTAAVTTGSSSRRPLEFYRTIEAENKSIPIEMQPSTSRCEPSTSAPTVNSFRSHTFIAQPITTTYVSLDEPGEDGLPERITLPSPSTTVRSVPFEPVLNNPPLGTSKIERCGSKKKRALRRCWKGFKEIFCC